MNLHREAGQLSKFGVRNQKLWMMRISVEGRKIAESLLDIAYSGMPLRQPNVSNGGKLETFGTGRQPSRDSFDVTAAINLQP